MRARLRAAACTYLLDEAAASESAGQGWSMVAELLRAHQLDTCDADLRRVEILGAVSGLALGCHQRAAALRWIAARMGP